LDAINAVLDERITNAAVDRAVARLRAGQAQHLTRRQQIERELSLIASKLSRLLQAIVSGGPIEIVVAAMKIEESRKAALAAELENLDRLGTVAAIDDARLKGELATYALDVRSLLGHHGSQARQMLRKLLVGQKITLTPVEVDGRRGYRFAGSGTYLRLMTGPDLPGRWWPQRDFPSRRVSADHVSRCRQDRAGSLEIGPKSTDSSPAPRGWRRPAHELLCLREGCESRQDRRPWRSTAGQQRWT